MNIAPRVQDYLAAQQSAYELLPHPRSGNSVQSARAAHVPAGGLAKGVVVKDDAGYVLAVLPSSCHVVLSQLGRALHRMPLQLAAETEFTVLFGDCDRGALPPLGKVYGLPMIVDEALDAQPEVYFEAGGAHGRNDILHLRGSGNDGHDAQGLAVLLVMLAMLGGL